MVKKKKGGVGKQRKPKKEKPVKEKHEDVSVKPKKNENKDNIEEEGEILEDILPEEAHGDRDSPKRGEGESRRRKDDVDSYPDQPSSKSRSRSRISNNSAVSNRSAHDRRSHHRSRNRSRRKDVEHRRRHRSREKKSRYDIRREPARGSYRRGRESYSPVRDNRRRVEWSRSRSRDRRGGNPFTPSRGRPRNSWYTPRSRERDQDRSHNLPMEAAGHFDNAMNLIASNAEANTRGIFSSVIDGRVNQSRHDNLTWAIAKKLDIGSAQMANEQALLNITKSKGSTADLKQALKARAAIYGSTLDPSHFRKGTDLSAKAKTTRDRRRARGMFISAPLFVAQAGAHHIRRLLSDGDRSTVRDMKPDTRGTAAQFMKAMAKAPVLHILEKVNINKYNELKESLLQQADDLDFLQTLVTSVHDEPAINPSMNALNDAFNRRRFAGRFKTPGRGIEMDTLLYQASKGAQDDDDTGARRGASSQGNADVDQSCYAFQRGSCHRRSNCRFRHRCLLCGSEDHGADRCGELRGLPRSSDGAENQSTGVSSQSRVRSRPPHPRFRRDRAHDASLP